MENRESSSTIQVPEDLPIQSAEKEDSSRDPAPAPAADIQAALGRRSPWPVVRGPEITLYIDHVERRELWKSRRTPASLSPVSDVSSPIDILLAGLKSLDGSLDDLIFSEIHEDISEQLEHLDLNSEQLASPGARMKSRTTTLGGAVIVTTTTSCQISPCARDWDLT